MDKKVLIQKFIHLIEETLRLAIESQKTTVDYVTDEDNKPENEYDTRGLEASYLARGQAERVADLKESLSLFKTSVVRDYDQKTAIGNTALVDLVSIDDDQDIKTVLLMPKGGGLVLNEGKKTIQVVTASSPLGQTLVGKKSGDEISYKVGDRTREYEILSVI